MDIRALQTETLRRDIGRLQTDNANLQKELDLRNAVTRDLRVSNGDSAADPKVSRGGEEWECIL